MECAIQATTNVVASTSPIASRSIARRLRRKSRHDVNNAAGKIIAGKMKKNTPSESKFTADNRGTKHKASPPSKSTIGYGSVILCASTARTPTAVNKSTIISAWFMSHCLLCRSWDADLVTTQAIRESTAASDRGYIFGFRLRAVLLEFPEMFFRPTAKSL